MFNRALPAAVGPTSGEISPGDEENSDGFACVPPEVIGVPFPTAAYDQNLFYAAVGYLLGLAMTMVSETCGCCTDSEACVAQGRGVRNRVSGQRHCCSALEYGCTAKVVECSTRERPHEIIKFS